MTLEREVNILREINSTYTVPIELYAPISIAYPPILEGHKWRGNITSFELSHNLKASNSLSFFLENEEGEPFMLLGGFKLAPSQGKVDLIELLFANRSFNFAEGTSLHVALDTPSRLREDDAITFLGAATETTLAGTDTSGEMLTEADLQDALTAYATTAEVATAIGAINTDAWEFVSDELTISNGAQTFTQVHGLGVKPALVSVIVRCKTAELGFAVGDEIEVTEFWNYPNSAYYGGYTAFNDTDVKYNKGPSGGSSGFNLGGGTLTAANWRLVIRARS